MEIVENESNKKVTDVKNVDDVINENDIVNEDDVEEPSKEEKRSLKNSERIYISLTTRLLPQLRRYFLVKVTYSSI